MTLYWTISRLATVYFQKACCPVFGLAEHWAMKARLSLASASLTATWCQLLYMLRFPFCSTNIGWARWRQTNVSLVMLRLRVRFLKRIHNHGNKQNCETTMSEYVDGPFSLGRFLYYHKVYSNQSLVDCK